MAYLRWRRFTELVSLDRPWLGELFMRKRGKPIVAAPVEKWDAEYQDGIYDRLNRSEHVRHRRQHSHRARAGGCLRSCPDACPRHDLRRFRQESKCFACHEISPFSSPAVAPR